MLNYCLIDNGISNYIIVINDEKKPSEYFCATELADIIFNCTNIKVEIIFEKYAKDNSEKNFIYLGKTNYAIKNNVFNKYNNIKDGFYIKFINNNIILTGSIDKGTLNGVYDFCERYLGVKFFAFDEIYYPRLNKVFIEAIDILEIPAFEYRMCLSEGSSKTESSQRHFRFFNQWKNEPQTRCGNSEFFQSFPDGDFIHSSLNYVPPNIYYTEQNKMENAHLYNIQNNKIIDICYSDGIDEFGEIEQNKDKTSIKIAIENLKKFVLLSDKNQIYFMFGQADTQVPCKCEKCKTLSKIIYYSGIILRFANLLAREINIWAKYENINKNIYVIVFGYAYTEEPPVIFNKQTGNITLLDKYFIADDHLIVKIAPANGVKVCFSLNDVRQREKYHYFVEKWKTVCKKIMVWNYNTLYGYYFGYIPIIDAWQNDLCEYRKVNVNYVFMEHNHSGMIDFKAQIETYVASKMLWNPDLNARKLQNEFIDGYYGEKIGIIIKEFILNYEKHYKNIWEIENIENLEFGLWEFGIFNAKYWNKEFFEKQISLINNAIKSIKYNKYNIQYKEKIIDRLENVKLTPLVMFYFNFDVFYPNDIKQKKKLYNEIKRLSEKFKVKYFAHVNCEGKGKIDLKYLRENINNCYPILKKEDSHIL